MHRCLKRPRRTYSKVTVSVIFLLWFCAFLYNNINIYFRLNWQEPTFSLRSLNTKNTTILPVFSAKAVQSSLKDPVTNKNNNLKIVTFLNGGKCGSTTLALLLKHKYPNYIEYDQNSIFIDAGKELCGNFPTFTPSTKKYILDACPRRMTRERATKTLQKDPPHDST